MGCTVAELLDRVSSSELTEWMAYCQLEAEDQAAAEKQQAKRRR